MNIACLCNHFKLIHKGFHQLFYCPYEGCIRQPYCNRSSYTIHIKSHSNNPLKNSKPLTCHDIPSISERLIQSTPETLEKSSGKPTSAMPLNILEDIHISRLDLSNSNNKFDLLLKTFKNSILALVIGIYSNSKLPVSSAQSLISDIQNLVIEPIVNIFEDVNETYATKLNELRSELLLYSTEQRLTKILIKKGLYQMPKKELLNEYSTEVMKKGKVVFGGVKEIAVVSDVEFQLKSFLEIPGIYDTIAEYTKSENESSSISSYISGEHWGKKKEDDKETLAVDLYYDDFEVNNPIGSNTGTNTMCAFYFNLPNLPPYLRTRLNNIFLALLVEVKLLKCEKSLESCCILLNQIFNKLSTNGIQINLNNKLKTIFFKIGIHKGDNLALNKILGFSPSFGANFYCRFCKIHRKDAMKKCDLQGVQSRTPLNYEIDSKENLRTTGIAFKSKFVDLKDFHPADNPYVCKMHDFDEGVVVIALEKVLWYFISIKKYFTISKINHIKKCFNYGEIEVGNKSGPIKIISKKVKGKLVRAVKLKGSASENICFLKLLPLMINSLVPKRDKVWSLLIKLVKLADILDLPTFTETDLKRLKLNITDFHKTFLKLFPKEHLRPKFHNLLHYPEILTKMGPPKTNNCYIFEQKHKQLKAIAKATTSRRLLPYTISKKIAIDFANRLFKSKNFSQKDFTNAKLSCLEKRTKYKIFFEKEDISVKEMLFYDRVAFRGQTYKAGFYITDGGLFFRIITIFRDSETYFLLLEEIKTVKSNTTFEIIRCALKKYKILEMINLRSFPINSHTCNNKNYIKSKLF